MSTWLSIFIDWVTDFFLSYFWYYSRRTLSDTFLALKSCVTQGMSVRFRDIPWVSHVSQNCVNPGKIALNFPLVTQFWEICVIQGMSRNLIDIPWVTQLFSAKNMSLRVCLLYFIFFMGSCQKCEISSFQMLTYSRYKKCGRHY